MTRITIPPAALEAGAKLLCARDEWKYPWDDLEEYDMQFYRDSARAAFEAMVAAWPMMHVHEWQRPWLGGMSGIDLILPLTEQTSE